MAIHDNDDVPVERISTLTKNRCCPKILLLASRLWNSVTNGKSVEDGGLDAIGVDEEGNAIHIVIDRAYAPYYRDILSEGHVYMFANIGCIPAAHYRPVMRAERLRVNAGTTITLVADFAGQIRPHYFEFQTFATAASRLNKDTFLTDLIGVITKIEDPSCGFTKLGEGTRSKFYIKDLSGNEFPINLWGDLSLKFRDYHLLESNRTTVVILCAMAIRKYQDEIHASTMSPSKFYINLDVPEVTELLARYEPLKVVPEILCKKGYSGCAMSAVQEAVQSRTVQDLLSGPSDSVKPGQRYNCKAKVLDFNINHPWFYTACKRCTRKLPPTETDLGCQKCNLGRSESMPWYRLETIVEDASATATFTIFGRSGEKLIGAPAELLVRSPTMDPLCLHPLMERVVGDTRVFQVTLKQGSFGDGAVQIMVQDVVAIPEETSKLKLQGVESGQPLESSAGSSSTGLTSNKRASLDSIHFDPTTLCSANKRNQVLSLSHPKILGSTTAKIGIDDSATGELIATIESTASAGKSSPIVPTPKRDKCGAIFECNATVSRKGGTLKNVVSTKENLLIGGASACKESASDSVETNCTLLDNDGEDDKPLAEIFAEQQSSRHARLARSCITVAKNAAMVRKKRRRCSKSEAKH